MESVEQAVAVLTEKKVVRKIDCRHVASCQYLLYFLLVSRLDKSQDRFQRGIAQADPKRESLHFRTIGASYDDAYTHF